mgnify:FL=1|tara:strand:+ start:1372 stop:3006 length:1635 start_codon:yes stop_codon:yes gene_type:complete
MCGIIGSTEHTINRVILNDIDHRGPDSKGLYCNKDVSLGHARLSIIDLSSGQQPMISDDGQKVLVFNGEIYNYRELKKNLDCEFSTSSDTEVLLKYYEKYGLEKTLKELNGMFAFSLYDKTKGKIFLARDRMGIKPLFYSLQNGLTFCSEISSVKDLIGIDNLSIDPIAVSMFFNTYYIASPNTIWNEIKSLEQGHYLEFDVRTKAGSIKKYWSLTPQERKESDLGHLENLLRDAVSLRTRSDVPYGAYLSGGVDSSLVVQHLSSIEQGCKTFTAVINDKELNEKEYASIVADKCRTNHTDIFVNYDEIKLNFLRKLVRHFGQPFADSSIIPTYLISNKISSNVTVALGGDGSDEVFCGYNKYNNPEKPITERFFRNTNLDFLEDDYKNDTYDYMLTKLPYLTRDKNELMRLLDIRFFLEGDILQKVDRMSMASSLEVRVPFLDHRIVEYSNCLTYESMFGKIRKYPIKRLLEQYFDKQFVHRNKIGFMLGFDGWNDKFDEVINNCEIMKSNVFKDNFDITTIKNGYLKFAFLMLCLWYEENYV